METDEERRARLEHLSANQHLRLSTETNDERAARLERLSANQHLRLSTETNDERAARLERLSANQHLRLAAETNSEKRRKNRSGFGFDLDLIRIEIGVFKKQIFSRNELARPVMGTIFLVL